MLVAEPPEGDTSHPGALPPDPPAGATPLPAARDRSLGTVPSDGRASSPPGKRHAFAAAAVDDGFYVFGGNRHVKGGKPLNFEDLWKFSIAANAWAEVKPVGGLPGSRGHHSLLALSPHAILLYGGALCNPGCKCYGDTWLFSATEAKWTFLNATDAPIHRYRQSRSRRKGTSALLEGSSLHRPPV